MDSTSWSLALTCKIFWNSRQGVRYAQQSLWLGARENNQKLHPMYIQCQYLISSSHTHFLWKNPCVQQSSRVPIRGFLPPQLWVANGNLAIHLRPKAPRKAPTKNCYLEGGCILNSVESKWEDKLSMYQSKKKRGETPWNSLSRLPFEHLFQEIWTEWMKHWEATRCSSPPNAENYCLLPPFFGESKLHLLCHLIFCAKRFPSSYLVKTLCLEVEILNKYWNLLHLRHLLPIHFDAKANRSSRHMLWTQLLNLASELEIHCHWLSLREQEERA